MSGEASFETVHGYRASGDSAAGIVLPINGLSSLSSRPDGHSPPSSLTNTKYRSNGLHAGCLSRLDGKPALEPVPEHPWESKYVLNAGAIALDGRVFLLYRAYGEEGVSRIGLAASHDGLRFTERLDRPVFEPMAPCESRGCEDPRLTKIGDRIFMTYTAFDGTIAQIALASISTTDFLRHRWGAWRRHGLFLPGCVDKDGALFPELFGGKFAMLHRIEPHIWIGFSSRAECPWPSQGHVVLASPTVGNSWDSNKIGAGAQPIKTRHGWLLITHGVDHSRVYRLGVMLLDLRDPTILIYRSPNYILEPITEWERGREGESWVPNVVFTCGAVPRDGPKDILDANDELIVYYGAADTLVSVATAKVGDLIPEEIRSAHIVPSST